MRKTSSQAPQGANRAPQGVNPAPQGYPQQAAYGTPSGQNAQQKKEHSRSIQQVKKSLYKQLRGKPAPPIYTYGPLQLVGLFLERSLKIVLIVLLGLFFFAGGLVSGIFYGYISSTEPLPTELLKTGSETSYIYDLEGNTLAKQTGVQNIDRQYIPYDEVKDTQIANAFISIEDERFMQHIGIDPKRIASAILSAVANGGTPTHGGSTIVQQTVKLISGNDQRSAQRKIQEWYRAILLNEQLSKNEIMELYINLVPMGNSYIGVEAAAEGYFGKHAKELTLPECAFLAGIPKGPSIYNPRTEAGMRNALRRQRVVLGKMYQLGKISQEEYKEALNTDIVLHTNEEVRSADAVHSYFVEYVIEQVVERLVQNGLNRNLAYQYVTSGGLKIYTTLEPRIQKILDETFQKKELFQSQPSYYEDFPEKPEAGMVIINNDTGAIAAMQGGYGVKSGNLLLNRATALARQPGSSIKPLVVYGPALDTGKFAAGSVVVDKEVFFNGPDKPWPTNYDMKYHGPVTLRNAMKASLNVPAVTILNEIGVATGKSYLKNMEIDWTKDDVGLAAAVGAPRYGVSPLQMAQAYATFANQGVYRRAYAFTKVEDRNGEVILDNSDLPQHRVFKPETAFIMDTMLQEDLRKITSAFGYYSDAADYFPLVNDDGEDIPVGGKTGTTDANVDKWFVGLTGYYTGAIWYGFDNKIKKTSIPEQDWNAPLRIWKDAFRQIHANLKPRKFSRPADIVEKRINVFDGLLASEGTPENYVMTEYYPENSPLIPNQYSGYGVEKSEDKEDKEKSVLDKIRELFGMDSDEDRDRHEEGNPGRISKEKPKKEFGNP